MKRRGWSGVRSRSRGNAALGPTPFMHRPPARDNPQVPLTHRYLNATLGSRIPNSYFIMQSMSLVALSELIGAAVRDSSGSVKGRVREVAVAPQDHSTRVAYLIVRTSDGER